MSDGNGHGIMLLGADGQPANKGDFARVNAVQRAVNILLTNDKNLSANQTTLLHALNALVERVAVLEAKLADKEGE